MIFVIVVIFIVIVMIFIVTVVIFIVITPTARQTSVYFSYCYDRSNVTILYCVIIGVAE